MAGLAILGQLDILDDEIHSTRDRLAWWLCERQLDCGGLNGRPEKKEDVSHPPRAGLISAGVLFLVGAVLAPNSWACQLD